MPSRKIFAAGNRWLLIYLTFLSAFAPLSTDMFLPALPAMTEVWQSSSAVMGLTISGFLFVFGFSMLFWGPLGDRYGRKPILFAGSLLFTVASVAVAIADSVSTLLFWRLVEGAGAGAVSATSMAIVKDILRGSLLEKVVTLMQAATILAPMVAPVLGGAVLMLLSWRGVFWCLAICGSIALAASFLLRETGTQITGQSLAQTFARMGTVLAIKPFRQSLLLFSAMAMPFMSYLAVSAYIFQDQFNQSAQAYSLFFAFNALISLAGPFAHLHMGSRFNRGKLILGHLLVMCFAGLAVCLWGGFEAWFFALLFAPVTFCGSAMRAPSTVLMMECVHGDNGIVTALINFGGLFFGALSMIIAAMAFWPDPALAVGVIAFTISGICSAFWLKIRHAMPIQESAPD